MRVLITHRDGREYSVLPGDFAKHYEPAGFRISSYEDGSTYEPPQRPKTARKAPKRAPRPTTPPPAAPAAAPTPPPATPTESEEG